MVDLTPLSTYFGIGLAGAAFLVAVTWARTLLRPAQPESVQRQGRPWGDLPYLGTDWSFKDSWFTDVSVGIGALAGLLGSAGILESILGSTDASKNAIARIAVAGAIAAVLGAVGPLFVKVIGNDSTTPNVLGVLAAAFLTFTGAIGQLATMTVETSRLETTHSGWIYVVGAIVGFLAFWTGMTLLRRNLLAGSTKPDLELSTEEKVALIMSAIHGPTASPADKAELLVLENQAKSILKIAKELDRSYETDGPKNPANPRREWLKKPSAHYAPAARQRSPLI